MKRYRKSASAEGGQSMRLSDIAIAITSLWRPEYLRRCLYGIYKNLPEVEVIVADDSDTDLCANIAGLNCIRLDHDAGLSAKRNAIVAACQKPLILLACDDFDFSTPEARDGVIRMAKILRSSEINIGHEIDLVAGRVNNKIYEGYLEYV
jgi:glycosyltransferase involved in cell wall biosynthesis